MMCITGVENFLKKIMMGVYRYLVVAVIVATAWSAEVTKTNAPLNVIRFEENPIIRPQMLPGKDGDNINGPSLIQVPTWLPGRMGKYYLYFAHHGGKYIRLAYADDIKGPWRIYTNGTLRLSEIPACKGHIASPDVIVDEERHSIRMYFHGVSRAEGKQISYVAVSTNGLSFAATPEPLGMFYFRVFQHEGWWYAMAKGGQLYRSKDGMTRFEKGGNPLPDGAARAEEDDGANSPGPRHVALHLKGDKLWVYYSNIGDAPERILRRQVVLDGDWKSWRAGASVEVVCPEKEYEGVQLPVVKSVAGAAKGAENALRDPAIFTASDGRIYLLYSVAGESGIGIAEIVEH